MFTAGPRLGSFVPIDGGLLRTLDRIYKRMQKSEARSRQTALKEVSDYVDALTAQRQAAAQQQAATQEQPGIEGAAPPGKQETAVLPSAETKH
jgi:hypothetical protein